MMMRFLVLGCHILFPVAALSCAVSECSRRSTMPCCCRVCCTAPMWPRCPAQSVSRMVQQCCCLFGAHAAACPELVLLLVWSLCCCLCRAVLQLAPMAPIRSGASAGRKCHSCLLSIPNPTFLMQTCQMGMRSACQLLPPIQLYLASLPAAVLPLCMSGAYVNNSNAAAGVASIMRYSVSNLAPDSPKLW